MLGEAAFHYFTVPIVQRGPTAKDFGGHRPPLQVYRWLASNCAWLQGNRLKTRDADWNGFVWTNWRHFLFVLRIAAMTWRRCAFVIEIIADSI